MTAGYIEDRWLKKRPDPVTGKRERTDRYGIGKRYRVGGIPGVRDRSFTALEDAKLWKATAQTDSRRGEHIDPRDGAILLKDYIENHWWPARSDPPSTRDTLKSRIWGHIIPLLGSQPLVAIRVEQLRGWVAQAGQRLDANSLLSTWSCLSTILQTAVEEGRLPRNLAKSKSIVLPAAPAQKHRAWTRDRVEGVRSGLTERYRILTDLGVASGLRQGETYGLSIEDLDAEAGAIHVRRQVLNMRSSLYFGPPKGGRERTVPASPELIRRIREHVASFPCVPVRLPWTNPEAPENDLQARQRKPQTHPLLVTTPLGNAINSKTWNTYSWKPALAAAGLITELERRKGRRAWEPSRELGFHALRHTFASVMLQASESPVTLAAWLGHRDPGFTLRTYAHFMPEAGSRGVPAMDRWLAT